MGAKFFYRNIDLVYFVNNKLINNNLISQKDRILLSFSGGQDSISFVFILNQLYSQLEFDITFFWCHHLWQTDAFYLMQQMTKLSFLLQFNSCFPIPLNSISSELLARKWRQRCSYRVSLFYNYSKIGLAHTFNDKVENIFLNFIRGTGLIGLAPLRWTQFISKSNITNEKHISRHNYLKRDSRLRSTKMNLCEAKGYSSVASEPLQGIKMNLPQLTQHERDVLPTKMNSFELAYSLPRGYGVTKFYKRKSLYPSTKLNPSGYGVSCTTIRRWATIYNSWQGKKEREQLLLAQPTKMNPYPLPPTKMNPIPRRGKGYANRRFSLRAGGIGDCKFILAELCIPRRVHFSGGYRRSTQRITNFTSSVVEFRTDPRFVRRFVQISKPPLKCTQKGIFCLATKAHLEVGTGVTNKYKAKSCRIFTSIRSSATLATSKSSIINSCSSVAKLPVRSKDYFTEQPMLCNWYKLRPPTKMNPYPEGFNLVEGSKVHFSGGSVASDKWFCFPLYPEGVWGISKICNTIWVPSKTSNADELRIEHGKQLLNCGKDCYIVRPLLSINRIELNKICYFWKLPIYPDKSNQKVKFFRNRVRGQLLPTIKLFFNLNIENIFLQLAKIVETEDYCLTQIVNEFTKKTDVYHTKLDIYSKKTITRNLTIG